MNVRWGDMDNLGHVNNATYFSYFEQARIEWLDEIGVSLREATGPVVMTASAVYLRPVVYPADIVIQMTMHSPKRSSFMVDYALIQDKTSMVTGETKIVWIDYQKEKSVPLPDLIRELIQSD
jgi:acyl-CoA thioester hydrolase